MTDFKINIDNYSNEIVIIKLEGYLDAHTAPELENQIANLVENDIVKIIIDFEKLNYISSAGLGVFMAYIEDIREKGGDIKFTNVPDKIYEVFDILGFPMIYEIYKDSKEAINNFNEISNDQR
ncbi:MAG TPA: STAS domain-containing protein [Ignavibacteriales bacterium]|nr:STAS domain-containing protein [Ignavibacteriales bacterium]HOL80967.1 STAS domain-containing protein [Ignavibacteriales bacterium]HOM64702.1 STAS domain-containing protein [Ignavibacteriales bacterium]HPD66766.1 STAS domain-containing protein [Ignavibacteriales bacterium]HPP32747.1 STAS domain-containing protein [Ignavibacteriales bacterium]